MNSTERGGDKDGSRKKKRTGKKCTGNKRIGKKRTGNKRIRKRGTRKKAQ